jgi:hypothetical protein
MWNVTKDMWKLYTDGIIIKNKKIIFNFIDIYITYLLACKKKNKIK